MQPLLQWKSNKNYVFWVCICSIIYPACNAHAPYCYPWRLRHYRGADKPLARPTPRCILFDGENISFDASLVILIFLRQSQWPRGLKRRSSAARLFRLWVRVPPRTWMFVCCECCVLSGRGLCDGLITRTEESYRLWRVVVCDQETSKTRRLKSATGLWKIQPLRVVTPGKQTKNIYIYISVFM